MEILLLNLVLLLKRGNWKKLVIFQKKRILWLGGF